MTKKAAKAPARKPAFKKAEAAAEVETSATADTGTGAGSTGGGSKVAKGQLVEGVADRAGLTKKQSEAVVNAAMEAMVDALRGGKSVGLPGLGTLSVKATAARTGVKPGTSEKIQIPAGRKVSFKVATTLKGSL